MTEPTPETTEVPKAPVVQEEKEQAAQKQVEEELTAHLDKLPDVPSTEQRELWKTEYGEIFASGFSPTEMYIFRPLSRPEYVKIQTMSQNPEVEMDQFKLEETICNTCVLYPAILDLNKKAGTAPSLSEQIMQNSNFLSPQAASVLVIKL